MKDLKSHPQTDGAPCCLLHAKVAELDVRRSLWLLKRSVEQMPKLESGGIENQRRRNLRLVVAYYAALLHLRAVGRVGVGVGEVQAVVTLEIRRGPSSGMLGVDIKRKVLGLVPKLLLPLGVRGQAWLLLLRRDKVGSHICGMKVVIHDLVDASLVCLLKKEIGATDSVLLGVTRKVAAELLSPVVLPDLGSVPEVEFLDLCLLFKDAASISMGSLAKANIEVLEDKRDDLEVVGQALLCEFDGNLENGKVRALSACSCPQLRGPTFLLEQRQQAAWPFVPNAVADQAVGLGAINVVRVRAREEEHKLTPFLDRNNAVHALPSRVERVTVTLSALERLNVRVGHSCEVLADPCLESVEVLPAQNGKLHDVCAVFALVEVEEMLPCVCACLLWHLLERVQVARAKALQGVRRAGGGAEELELPPPVVLKILVVLTLDGVKLAIRQISTEERAAEEA
mmetsp:Transcript_26597/g.51834  ORF Transcript_26597/g.51834 Transcript_26597/m.51834 type:complete len:455 (+) Transcript_26597:1913-3277(+)